MKLSITLPTSWSEVTIQQFTELNRLRDLALDKIEYILEALSILSGTDKKDISRLTIHQIKILYDKIQFTERLEFEDKITEKIEMDGKEYNVCLDVSKISSGQYIDLKSYTKDKEDILNKLHLVMSVFYIPKGHEYNDIEERKDGYSAVDVSELFYKRLTMDKVYPMAFFFSTLLKESMMGIRDYLIEKSRKQTIQMIASLKEEIQA
jgi:hypothetical protein